MTNRYDDIINLDPPAPLRGRMSIETRAAQFAPFAALTGHDEALAETARVTSVYHEPGEYDMKEISSAITLIMMSNQQAVVEVTYFVPDKRKKGGEYRKMRGIVRRIDEADREIVFSDATRIPFSEITSLRIIEQ